MNHFKFEGLLKENPFPMRLFRATGRNLNLSAESDFLRVTEFKINSDLPILISIEEHILLIELLIEHALEFLGDINLILLKFVSSNIRLPSTFLKENILLVLDPYDESKNLLFKKTPHLCIEDSFVHDRNKCGHNQLKINYYTNKLNKDPLFNRFKYQLKSYHIEEI